MYNDLKDKVALITGGASGIGKAIAERYAEEGMKVVINYHSREDEASELVESIKAKGGEAVAVKADTTNEEEFLSLFQKQSIHMALSTLWSTMQVCRRISSVTKCRQMNLIK